MANFEGVLYGKHVNSDSTLAIDTPVKMFSVPLSSARTEVADMDKYARGLKSVLDIHFAGCANLFRTLDYHGPLKFRKS